jgi:DNA polymerase-3 subunit beta
VKISLPVSALEEVLVKARYAISERASMMAYSGILLEAADGTLSATGTDGENTITGYVKATVTDGGSALLLAKPLIEWLHAVPRGSEVTLANDGDGEITAQVKKGSPYQFRTIAMNFPKPPGVNAPGVAVNLADLGVALGAVRASSDAAHTSTSSATAGLVQLVSTDGDMHLNTTDTYRLSQAVLKEAGWGEFSGLLPVAMLERVAKDVITSVAVDQKGRIIEFSGPGARYSMRLSPVPFPLVDATLAVLPANQAGVVLADLRTVLARLAALAEGNPMRCDIRDGRMSLAITSPLGEGEETLEVDGTGEVSFAVNLEYLRAALSGCGGEQVTLGWTNATSPVFLISREPITVTTVVMPVRL